MQVWTQPKLLEVFVKCCQKTMPQRFQVLMHLPPVQLRALFLASLAQGEDIRRPLIEHVKSLPGHQVRSIIPRTLFLSYDRTLQQAHVSAKILHIIMEDPTTVAPNVWPEDEEGRATGLREGGGMAAHRTPTKRRKKTKIRRWSLRMFGPRERKYISGGHSRIGSRGGKAAHREDEDGGEGDDDSDGDNMLQTDVNDDEQTRSDSGESADSGAGAGTNILNTIFLLFRFVLI